MVNFFRKRLNKKGFTLVELLIVIAVIGIMAGIGINSMGNVTTGFKQKADLANAEMIARAIEVQVLAGNLAPADVATEAKVNTATDNVLSAEVQSGATGYFVESFSATTGEIVIGWGVATGNVEGESKLTTTIAKGPIK